MKRILILLIIFLAVGLTFHIWPTFSQSQNDQEEAEYPTEPIIFTKPLKAVIFDHKVHVEKAGLSCEDCHEDLFEMEAGSTQKNEDFNMQALYNGKYCGACHDGETAFASNTRCATCHIGVMGYKRLVKHSETESSGKE
ncbi:cytochrome c3 family protein [Thermosulfurimonas sp. F29]|uniref:cytochrome c3 family protein n=1 Tax=Thermosulfurimonas sp. F29 TaxID=2867247 RepID=UPI001C8389C8|nr:cytochrome c3 family protein [Thermosulfurimonas sp. F29]MBX6423161.1 cytochrome c3 family protein [Thermosulfurimonas sp. F29]